MVETSVAARLRSRHGQMPSILDGETGWYQGWYFELRLDEEVSRSSRYELPFSVVILFLSGADAKNGDSRLLNALLSDIVARKLRRSDLPGIIGLDQFGVLLPHTNAAQAEIVARRLTKWFEPFATVAGIASFPEDGQSAQRLFTVAEVRAAASLTPSIHPDLKL